MQRNTRLTFGQTLGSLVLCIILSSIAGRTVQAAALSLSGATGSPGSAVNLNLSLTSGGGTVPASVQVDLTYSTSDLSPLTGSYYAVGTAGSAAGKSASCSLVVAGDIRCIVSGIDTTAISDGVIASISFQIASATQSTSTPVSLSAPMASDGNCNLVATTGSGATVTINQPVAPVLSNLVCSPGSLTPPGPTTCTVSLSGNATSTTAVGLSSDNSAAPVPSSVNVSSGSSSANFTVNTTAVSTSTTAHVTATLGVNSKVFSLSLNPPAPSCTYALGANSANYTASAATGSVNVITTSGCAWSVTNNSSFITVTGGSSGSGNGTVSYSIPANLGASQSGTLTIANHTFTVTQAGQVVVAPSPSFTVAAAPSTQTVTAGSAASYTATVTAQNGFTGSVSLSASGLPAGAVANFSFTAVSTSGSVVVNVTTSPTTPPGNYAWTITGVSGGMQQSAGATLVVNAASPVVNPAAPTLSPTTAVTLAFSYNRSDAIVKDGTMFDFLAGLDQLGGAYSANLLGSTVSVAGTSFTLGPPNAPDAVSSAKVLLPAGQYSALGLLATGTSGNQTAQSFRVTYTDGSSATYQQSLSDWLSPQSYAGESIAATMPYRDASSGGQKNIPFYLYSYSFPLDETKTVASVTLPNNANVVVLAMTLIGNSPSSGQAGSFGRGLVLATVPVSQTVKAGTGTSYSVLVAAPNGFAGAVSLSASGLPAGAFANFSPSSVSGAGAVTVYIVTSPSTPAGTYSWTIAGVLGGVEYDGAAILVVRPGSGGGSGGRVSSAIPVDLSGVYNRKAAIVTDMTPFDFLAGVDQFGGAYSANLLGSVVNTGGISFNLGPPNALDAVSSAKVTLPAGHYSALNLLATGVNGYQSSQTFQVAYTDGTTANYVQSLSDWSSPQSYAGENIAVTMPYRDSSTGGQKDIPFYLYNYTFLLDGTKTLSTVTLPNNANVVVLAMAVTPAQ